MPDKRNDGSATERSKEINEFLARHIIKEIEFTKSGLTVYVMGIQELVREMEIPREFKTHLNCLLGIILPFAELLPLVGHHSELSMFVLADIKAALLRVQTAILSDGDSLVARIKAERDKVENETR